MKRCLIAALVAALALAPIKSDAVSPGNSDSYSDGGVSLQMTQPPGTVFNPGDEIGFRLQSDENAYVIVFNIDTEGYVNLLYPAKGERPAHVREGETYLIPDENSEVLVVEGRTGVEFLFALVVPGKDDIDRRELDYLGKANNLPAEERYRIDGDPFIAANIIAGELVRGISRREGIYLDYTYFFINERVAYPCYLCGECDGVADTDCADFIVTANFAEDRPLTYPMRRGYEMVEPPVSPAMEGDVGMASAPGEERTFGQYESDDGTVNINFYPYNSEVYYETRETLTKGTEVDVYVYGRDPYWYDPWYHGWYYYPTVSVGFYWGWPSFWWGFNWGCWGGYYCSAWYSPRCYTVYDYYCYDYGYYDGGYRYKPDRYKDKYYAGDVGGRRDPYKRKYKEGSAYGNAYAQSTKRDNKMRLASASVKSPTGRLTKGSSRGSIASRKETIARGTKAIGKTTRVRNFSSKTASRAKYASAMKTRTSYTPRSRKSYGTNSPTYGSSRGKTTLKPRTGRSGNPAFRGGKSTTTKARPSSRATYQGSKVRSGSAKSRSTSSGSYRSTRPRSKSSAVRGGRSSSSRSKTGYKPASRSSRSGSRSAVKSSRSGSRSSGRSSGARRSSGGSRSRSGGKGRK